jgi:hypothetical protein
MNGDYIIIINNSHRAPGFKWRRDRVYAIWMHT